MQRYYFVTCARCHRTIRHDSRDPWPCRHCGSQRGIYKGREVALVWGKSKADLARRLRGKCSG